MNDAVIDPQRFLEESPLVPIVFDLATDQVAWIGPQAAAHLGYEAARWTEPGFWNEVILAEDREMVRAARTRRARSGTSHSIDYRLRHADGRIVWTAEMGRIVPGPDGSFRLEGFLIDVTERKQREVTLWKSEEHLRSLLRNAPDAMVLTDAEGLILNMNDQAEALFLYRHADITGSLIDHLVPERLRQRLPELRAAFERDPERRSLIDGHSFAIERPDGTEIPVELSMSLIVNEDDRRQILCSVRDLTARRRVEAKLRSSERQLREIANVLPAMVCFVDRTHRYRFVNDAYARWHGWQRKQMEGRYVREVIGERLFRQMLPSVEAALAGDANHFRGDVTNASGTRLPVDVSLVPQEDDEGGVAGYFVVIFDVSDEVAAREADRRHRNELARVSRVATMGELAASIAHELNQPLSAIVANAQAAQRLLRMEPLDMEEIDLALSDVAGDGQRAGDVIASMRQLIQRGETRDDPVDVLGLVRDVIDLLHSEAVSRRVTVTTMGSDSALPSTRGDEAQLKQVFLNLIMNAIEAVSRVPEASRTVQVITSLKGSEIQVAVSDNGPGLAMEDPEELFQAFVSRRSGGLGMGLTISRTIAEAHGGRLWARENEAEGATFVLRLPLP